MRRTVFSALTALRADQLRALGLHQLLRDRVDRLTDHVAMLIAQRFLTTSWIVILS
jgi:hypothetical protein